MITLNNAHACTLCMCIHYMHVHVHVHVHVYVHNFIFSSTPQSRAITRSNKVDIKEGIKYNSIESSESEYWMPLLVHILFCFRMARPAVKCVQCTCINSAYIM